MDRLEDLDQGLTPSVAVIGAGYAGCAAAVELAAEGFSVTLLEASRTLGGRARRVDIAHGSLDNGQHILAGAYSETLALMKRVGADPEQLLLRLPLGLIFPGKLALQAPRLPAPLHMAAALLGARGLDWREKLAALHFMAHLKLRGFRLDRDTCVADLLLCLHQPARLIRLLWEPLCVATLNTPTEQASAQVFANVLRDTLAGDARASDILLPRVDLSRLLPEPAADYLCRQGATVRLSHPVRSISPDGAGAWHVTGDGWEESHTAVILATAPQHAAALLPEVPETRGARETLSGLAFEPILTCYLGYSSPVTLPSPMIGLDGGLGQWVFQRDAFMDTGGQSILAVVVSASGRLRDMPPDELARTLHSEIAAALGPLPKPVWHQLITERRATFACTPGLRRPSMHSGLPGLLLAGDYVDSDYPATLETAVRNGLTAGRYIINH